MAGQRIRRGISVVVFPEGTRGEGDELLPFKKGGFVLALETGTPIAPVALVGTSQVMPKNSMRVESGEVEVRIGEPIDTAAIPLREKDRLLQGVRDSIIGLMQGGTVSPAHGSRSS